VILGAVGRYRAFHASDRLLSVPVTRKNPDGAHDIRSNKTVIVVGADCWIVLGYSRLAYLDGKPTDQYIAEAISGVDDLSQGGLHLRRQPPGLHYREITNRIGRAIKDGYARATPGERRYGIEVLGVGVQNKWKPRGLPINIRHVAFHTEIDGGGNFLHEELAPRNLPWMQFLHWGIGSLDENVPEVMRQRLRASVGGPDAFRDIMAQAVAETGRNSTVVGEDVMSVILDPIEQTITTHFHPADPAAQPRGVATPWILALGQLWAPSTSSPSGWRLEPPGVVVQFSGFGQALGENPRLEDLFFGSQDRQPPPR
jgi:hypothetical protein